MFSAIMIDQLVAVPTAIVGAQPETRILPPRTPDGKIMIGATPPPPPPLPEWHNQTLHTRYDDLSRAYYREAPAGFALRSNAADAVETLESAPIGSTKWHKAQVQVLAVVHFRARLGVLLRTALNLEKESRDRDEPAGTAAFDRLGTAIYVDLKDHALGDLRALSKLVDR